MVLAPLVQNMKPLLLEQRSWTFSALRVFHCILRKTNANLRPEVSPEGWEDLWDLISTSRRSSPSVF